MLGSRPTTSGEKQQQHDSKKANTICIHRRTYRQFSQPVSLMLVFRLRPMREGWEHLNCLAGEWGTGRDRREQEQGGLVMTWGQSHLWEERQLVRTAGKQEQEAAGRADCRVSSTRSAHKERFHFLPSSKLLAPALPLFCILAQQKDSNSAHPDLRKGHQLAGPAVRYTRAEPHRG